MDGSGGVHGLRVLVLAGGWEGHHPDEVARWAVEVLLAGLDAEVTLTSDLDVLTSPTLAAHDLLLPVWTWGTITIEQELGFERAVRDGLGLVAWHGASSAFLGSRLHKFVLGGQFVDHPGGDRVRFSVEFDPHHPLAAGLDDFELMSEQYYLLVDPAIDVVATTTMVGSDDRPWTAGVRMPVAWTRQWGAGRVFYCSIGHDPTELAIPQVCSLLGRAVEWAPRPRH